MKTLILPEELVRDLLSMREVVEVVESAFREKALGRVQMPPKTYLFYDDVGDLRVMPCYMSSSRISSVKIVNSHPRNRERGFPTVMATILLIDPETGFPRAIMGGTWITGMRTGAAGAVAVKYLARRDSRVVAFIGAGAQARMQLLGVREVLPSIREVRVFDIRSSAGRNFLDYAEKICPSGCSLRLSDSAREAVMDADVIVTTTPSRRPIVMSEWISEGVHLNCMGADAPGKQELDPEILRRASKIVVDDVEQAVHSGELNVPIRSGIIRKEAIYGEIGEIVAGFKKGREGEGEITVFSSTGLAIQDAVTAELAYRKALEKGLGWYVDLVLAGSR